MSDTIDSSALDWSAGEPVLKDRPTATPTVVRNMFFEVLSCTYQMTDEDDPSWEGKSNLEVMVRKATRNACQGDMEAMKEVLDRSVGKAKQIVESASVSLTYQEYLSTLVQEEANMPKIPMTVTALEGDDYIDSLFITDTEEVEYDILAGL